MKNNVRTGIGKAIFSLLLVGSFLTCQQVSGAEVIKLNESQARKSLKERWDLAKTLGAQEKSSGGYRIGYCVSRTMEKNSFIGRFDSRKRVTQSLFETIYGYKDESDVAPEFNECCGSFSGNFNFTKGEKTKETMIKKVAVLALVDAKGTAVKEVQVSNMSLAVDLEKLPLVWLEGAGDDESMELLTSLYTTAKQTETKEEFIRAIGLHQYSTEVFSFLKGIAVNRDEEDELREEAVFWIGQFHKNEVLPFLTGIARNDNSEDVREKAVFSIYEVETEAATDSLISLSRKGHDKETRSKAIFWLSERASKKALKTIKDVIDDDDEDSEVQRQALFALTQMNDDENNSVEELITIAKKHHNRKLRKEAIFWLGQSENPKAIDALIEIVKQ